MANQEQLSILAQGVEAWNQWRKENRKVAIDLQGANLAGARLRAADLFNADLHKADLAGAYLPRADFYNANLSETNLYGANLRRVKLERAKLNYADLRTADFRKADFLEADLSDAKLAEAKLQQAQLVDTNLERADLSSCFIYGISAWNVKLAGASQTNLVITQPDEPTITVDNLEVAQFVYLLLNNAKIRDVIDTIAKKAVLILGRFTPERKLVLDAIRAELRRRGCLPILFDFDKPSSRNLTETVSTLAHMARFVIADITDAKSIPQELQRIVPSLPSLPVQPLLLSSQYEYAMFNDFRDYPWVLSLHQYDSVEDLLASLAEKVIAPPTAKAKEIEERRRAFEEEIGK
jgi:uncharacterized protein YjbI with pentapeptide repeats